MSNRHIPCQKLSSGQVTTVRNTEVPLSLARTLKVTRELDGTSHKQLSARSSGMASSRSTASHQFIPDEAVLAVKDKLTKQMNFPLDDNLYKGLVPVNVNDSIRHNQFPPAANQRAMHKKYLHKMKNKKRDPEPDLSDFLTEIEPINDVYPQYKIDSSISMNRLPALPRNNLDKISEIYVKLCANY